MDTIPDEPVVAPPKRIGRLHIRLGYWYDHEARHELQRLGEIPPRRFLLIEGAGKVAAQRIKQYGVGRVVEMLKAYLQSEKFLEYPRLTAALSADTIVKIEMEKLK